MTRPQPLVARPWLMRWLLVALTLAGLGIWQSGHCADRMAVAAGAPSVTVRDAAVLDGAVTGLSPAVHGHDHGHTQPDGPGSAADDCDIVPATTLSSITVTPSVSLATRLRTPAVAATRPQLLRPRLLPAVTLAHLGVSRT